LYDSSDTDSEPVRPSTPVHTRSRGPPIFDKGDLEQYLRTERLFRAMIKKNAQPAVDLPLDEKTVNELTDQYLDTIDLTDVQSEHSILSDLERYDNDHVGLKRLLLHLVKPVWNVLDEEKRDDPAVHERSLEHLSRINRANVNRALKLEPAHLFHTHQLGQIIKGLEMLQADVSGLKQAASVRDRALIGEGQTQAK
jgi:hypothetical protein